MIDKTKHIGTVISLTLTNSEILLSNSFYLALFSKHFPKNSNMFCRVNKNVDVKDIRTISKYFNNYKVQKYQICLTFNVYRAQLYVLLLTPRLILDQEYIF